MRFVPLSEVVKMGEGEPVPYTRGVITYVGEYYEGIIQKGQRAGEKYQLQNVTIADPTNKAVTMGLKLDGREAITTAWKGKTVHLLSHQGTKGMSGLVIRMDGKEGKEKLVIKVTPSAEITLAAPAEATTPASDNDGDLGPQTAPAPASAQAAQQSQPAKPPTTPSAAPAKREKDPVIEAMVCAGQVGNLIKVAYWKAHGIAQEIEDDLGFKLSTEQIGSAAMNITIQLEKMGVHMQMPAKPIARPEKKS